MARASKAPTTIDAVCHVAAIAQQFHELIEASDKLERQHLKAGPQVNPDETFERLQQRIGDADGRLRLAASYAAAGSTEGAIFQLGLMMSLAEAIGHQGLNSPWPDDASMVAAIQRMAYSVVNFIREGQGAESASAEYFFRLEHDPHRVAESIANAA